MENENFYLLKLGHIPQSAQYSLGVQEPAQHPCPQILIPAFLTWICKHTRFHFFTPLLIQQRVSK